MHDITVADRRATPGAAVISVGRGHPGDTVSTLHLLAADDKCLVLLDYDAVIDLIGHLGTVATLPHNSETWQTRVWDDRGYHGPTVTAHRPQPGSRVELTATNPAARTCCQVQLDPAALAELLTHLGAYLADG